MSVMVFAIPIGASAEVNYSSEDIEKYPYEIVYRADSDILYIRLNSPDIRFYIENEQLFYVNNNDTLRYALYRDGKPPFYSTSSQGDRIRMDDSTFSTSRVIKSQYDIYDGATGSTVFMPAPKPVQIQAVKSVEEILPQTGKVAGGIVLVASILLGLWLVIGLVRRLVFSYLR